MEHYQFIVCYYCITKRDGHNNDGHIKTKFFFLILLFFFFCKSTSISHIVFAFLWLENKTKIIV